MTQKKRGNPTRVAETFRQQHKEIGSETLPEKHTLDQTERARVKAAMDRIPRLDVYDAPMVDEIKYGDVVAAIRKMKNGKAAGVWQNESWCFSRVQRPGRATRNLFGSCASPLTRLLPGRATRILFGSCASPLTRLLPPRALRVEGHY